MKDGKKKGEVHFGNSNFPAKCKSNRFCFLIDSCGVLVNAFSHGIVCLSATGSAHDIKWEWWLVLNARQIVPFCPIPSPLVIKHDPEGVLIKIRIKGVSEHTPPSPSPTNPTMYPRWFYLEGVLYNLYSKWTNGVTYWQFSGCSTKWFGVAIHIMIEWVRKAESLKLLHLAPLGVVVAFVVAYD